MRTSDTPIFEAVAREFEAQRPLFHVVQALGGDAFADPLNRTRTFDVAVPPSGASSLPRRGRQDGPTA
ncbi:hypothetical protein ACNHYB_02195 [Isoptericola jiangsuensis]|uniref:hypothetical protein n=1 Tax=Isoptericola jiangsuensis TaxID=548579 RepID=UPI003AAAAED3